MIFMNRMQINKRRYCFSLVQSNAIASCFLEKESFLADGHTIHRCFGFVWSPLPGRWSIYVDIWTEEIE